MNVRPDRSSFGAFGGGGRASASLSRCLARSVTAAAIARQFGWPVSDSKRVRSLRVRKMA